MTINPHINALRRDLKNQHSNTNTVVVYCNDLECLLEEYDNISRILKVYMDKQAEDHKAAEALTVFTDVMETIMKSRLTAEDIQLLKEIKENRGN